MGESIDPIDYDVVELRELARVRGDRYVADGFLWSELPDSFPSTEGTAEYDRPSTWTGSLEERQKPYLRRLPEDGAGDRIAREWVQGLVECSGSDAAIEALAYYESLGWLTEAVREELEGYLLAVGYRPGGSLDDLTRADHVESLASTARLARLVDTGSGSGSGTGNGTADGESTGPDTSMSDGEGSVGGVSGTMRDPGMETSDSGSPALVDEPSDDEAGSDTGVAFEEGWVPAVPLDADAERTAQTDGWTGVEGERHPGCGQHETLAESSVGAEDGDVEGDEDDESDDSGFRFGSGSD